jgi:hypothetical protein
MPTVGVTGGGMVVPAHAAVPAVAAHAAVAAALRERAGRGRGQEEGCHYRPESNACYATAVEHTGSPFLNCLPWSNAIHFPVSINGKFPLP